MFEQYSVSETVRELGSDERAEKTPVEFFLKQLNAPLIYVLIAAVSLTAFLMLPCALLGVNDLPVNLENLSAVLRNGSVLSKAQTYAFTVLGMSQLYHAVGMRDVHRSFFRMNHRENKLMIFACVIGFLLQFAVTEVPFLINAFGTSHLTGREWLRLGVLAAAPLITHEILVLVGALAPERRKAS